MNTNKYIHMLGKEKHRKTIDLNPLSPQWSRQAVDTSGKSLFFFFFIFLDTDPHLASVCVISISFPFRDTSRVCVGTCVRVCV